MSSAQRTAPSSAPSLAASLRVFRALADPIRLRALEVMSGWVGPRSGPLRPGEEGLCLRDLRLALGVPHPLLSHHLRTLRECGLIEVERRGRWAIHRLRRDRCGAIAGLLLQLSPAPAAPVRPALRAVAGGPLPTEGAR